MLSRIIKKHKENKSNAVSIGTTAVKPYLSIWPVGLVWFAKYCGKMYSRRLFSYGRLLLFPDNFSILCNKLVWVFK